MPQLSVDSVRDAIRAIPNFPKEGILFRDIMPVLKDPVLFEQTLAWFEEQLKGTGVEYVVGIESRGFIFAAALAQRLKIGFVPARKSGKLPGLVERHQYDLEYGTDCIEMHQDAFPKGAHVAIVDDLLATGGTANATLTLVNKLGGRCVSILFMIELIGLPGRECLSSAGCPVKSMVTFD